MPRVPTYARRSNGVSVAGSMLSWRRVGQRVIAPIHQVNCHEIRRAIPQSTQDRETLKVQRQAYDEWGIALTLMSKILEHIPNRLCDLDTRDVQRAAYLLQTSEEKQRAANLVQFSRQLAPLPLWFFKQLVH